MIPITITQKDDHLEVKFGGYDPDAVATVKAVPGRRYNPEDKIWSVPLQELEALRNGFPTANYIGVEETQPLTRPDVEVDFHGYVPLTEPYSYQKIGSSFLSLNGGALFDECGTGKSRQALDAFGILKKQGQAKRMLVICPVSLMRNWADEIQKHSQYTYVIVDDVKMTNYKKKSWVTNLAVNSKITPFDVATRVDITIINYDKVRISKVLRIIQSMIENGVYQVVCCDEAHRCKNRQAQQTKAVISLKTPYRFALTATPLANKPEEIQPLGDWVTHNRAFGGWTRFSQRYLEWGMRQVSRSKTIRDIVGYRNQGELREKIGTFSLRRRKDDVLDLPPKTFQSRYYPMTEKQERAYDEMKAEFLTWLRTRKDDFEEPLAARSVLTQLIRLNQIASNLYIVGAQDEGSKYDGLLDLAGDLLYNDHKVVIWSHWVQGVELAYKRLSQKYQGVMIHGGVNASDRQLRVTDFQDNPETKFFVGNPDCAGLGLNLYRADTEIVIDSGYSFISYVQMIDRCHRIGQKNPVTIINMLATYRDGRPTVDAFVFKKLQAKAEMSAGLLDDRVNPFANIGTDDLLRLI